MRTIYGEVHLGPETRPRARRSRTRDFWQAGKAVASISSIEPAGDIVRRFAAALLACNAAEGRRSPHAPLPHERSHPSNRAAFRG